MYRVALLSISMITLGHVRADSNHGNPVVDRHIGTLQLRNTVGGACTEERVGQVYDAAA